MTEKLCKVLILTDANKPEAPAMELTVGIELDMSLEDIKANAIIEIQNRTDWNPKTCTILLTTITGDLIAEYPPDQSILTLVKS